MLFSLLIHQFLAKAATSAFAFCSVYLMFLSFYHGPWKKLKQLAEILYVKRLKIVVVMVVCVGVCMYVYTSQAHRKVRGDPVDRLNTSNRPSCLLQNNLLDRKMKLLQIYCNKNRGK